MLSIVLPHLSSAKPVELFKKYLAQNTVNKYELIEVIDWTDVYGAYNYGASLAKYDKIVLMNDDMFVAPGWDINFVKFILPNTYTTMYLVESGHISVNSRMIEYDCGRTLETFDYEKFIKFTQTLDVPEYIMNTAGAWMPIGFHKSTWIPYPNEIKYPHPNDIELTDKILPRLGYIGIKVKSFAYHLQGYSRR